MSERRWSSEKVGVSAGVEYDMVAVSDQRNHDVRRLITASSRLDSRRTRSSMTTS